MRPVQPSRQRKSVGYERTFPKNMGDRKVMLSALQQMAGQVAVRLHALGLAGRTVGIKARLSDFRTVTRAHTVARPIRHTVAISAGLPELLNHAIPVDLTAPAPTCLLGVTVSSLPPINADGPETGQLNLLEVGDLNRPGF
jgi:DNA polymerase-4